MGHIDYLSKAKDLVTKLIVGVNLSESVEKLKGPSRPIHSSLTRSTVLAAFEFIDLVIIFEEDTPYQLIESIKPDVLVKGSDYEGKKVVGQDIADELKLVEFVDGKSTTKTIEKIRKS